MTTRITHPITATFIHIPKTGGMSVTQWLTDNFSCAEYDHDIQHGRIRDITKKNPGIDVGWTFCTVRNPWDYCVSYYYYQIWLANYRINYLQTHPESINVKDRTLNLDFQKQELKHFVDIGFENWLLKTRIPPLLHWAKDVDHVMKFENLESDFGTVQEKLNCYKPLPHINQTRNSENSYRKHYTSQRMIDKVSKHFSEDIKRFGYEY